MYSESQEKANILNAQFKSVFSKITNKITPTPHIFGKKIPAIKPLTITLNGVTKLLEKIQVTKAAGPDAVPGRILR